MAGAAVSPILSKLGAGIRELLDAPEGEELPIEMRKLLVELDEMSPEQPSVENPRESERG